LSPTLATSFSHAWEHNGCS